MNSIRCAVTVVTLQLLFLAACQPAGDSSLAQALSSYVQDLRKRSEPLPESLTLSTLVDMGYLPASASNRFGDITLEFYPAPDETFPQAILMAAVAPDGSAVVVLGDGSVQQVNSARYTRLKAAQTGQPDAPGNRRPAPRQ